MKENAPPQIRMANLADADAIARIYAPYVVETAISFEDRPPSGDEIRARMEPAQDRYPWLVAEEDGEVVGFAYGGAHRPRACYRWSVDVSVYLCAAARGRGLGKALYAQLLEVLTRQGFVNAYAGITLPNPASVGLHESFGFKPVGVYEDVGFKFGSWHSVGWWQKPLGTRPKEPTQPRSIVVALENALQ